MNKVLSNIEINASKAVTANGDLAHSTTCDSNLDFFFSSSLFRSNSEDAVVAFTKAYAEDKNLAIKNLAYLRDIRGGLGFRDSFKKILFDLSEKDPSVVVGLLDSFVELGRWDDILHLVKLSPENPVYIAVVEKVFNQFHIDYLSVMLGKENGISLLSKWMPKINSQNHETRSLAYKWANILFRGPNRNKEYRGTLKLLRDKLNILETHLVNRDYSFEYSTVPGRAMKKYQKAFVKNDGVRYHDFVNSTKVEGSKEAEKLKDRVRSLYPYEILQQAVRNTGESRALAEELWKALPQEGSISGNVLTVYDGSASMGVNIKGSSASVMDVAQSLAIYTSERLTGSFKDKVISFSRNPQFIDLGRSNGSLYSRQQKLAAFNRAENTDLTKVFDLVLESSIGAAEEDCIDTILIVTDCEFDEVYSHQGVVVKESTFQNAKRKFSEAGVPLPKIVYWNLNSSRLVVPISKGELDSEQVILVSGFSTHILDSISKNEFKDGREVMNDALSKYDYLLELLEK